jgi:hypothetical protein
MVFQDGWWSSDIGEMYSRIVFDNDGILVGPRFEPNDYLVVSIAEIHATQ